MVNYKKHKLLCRLLILPLSSESKLTPTESLCVISKTFRNWKSRTKTYYFSEKYFQKQLYELTCILVLMKHKSDRVVSARHKCQDGG